MKKKILVCVFLCIFAVGIFLLSIPSKEILLITDSTHERVKFLSFSTTSLSSQYAVKFVAYDPDCDMIQICISAPKNDRTLFDGEKITFNIDGFSYKSHSLAIKSGIWKDYFNFLLENIPSFDTMNVEYIGGTIDVTQGDEKE